jgi:hypothetical protein
MLIAPLSLNLKLLIIKAWGQVIKPVFLHSNLLRKTGLNQLFNWFSYVKISIFITD